MTELQVAELKLKLAGEIKKGIADIMDGIYTKKNEQTVSGIEKLYSVLDIMAKEIKNCENSNLNAENN